MLEGREALKPCSSSSSLHSFPTAWHGQDLVAGSGIGYTEVGRGKLQRQIRNLEGTQNFPLGDRRVQVALNSSSCWRPVEAL